MDGEELVEDVAAVEAAGDVAEAEVHADASVAIAESDTEARIAEAAAQVDIAEAAAEAAVKIAEAEAEAAEVEEAWLAEKFASLETVMREAASSQAALLQRLAEGIEALTGLLAPSAILSTPPASELEPPAEPVVEEIKIEARSGPASPAPSQSGRREVRRVRRAM